MANWDDSETALRVSKLVRRIAADEINKQRPAPRYATVQSIDHDDRSVMATFVGETDPVRIPYLDTVPSVVGQEIRVDGTGSDRYVGALRGTSDAEARVEALETWQATVAPMFFAVYRGADTNFASGVTKMTWLNQRFYPVGFAPMTAGNTEVIIPADGYYEFIAQITVRSPQSNHFYFQVLPADASGNYDIGHIELNNNVSLQMRAMAWLHQNDHLCVNAAGSDTYTMVGGIETTFSGKRLLGGPLQVAPPVP